MRCRAFTKREPGRHLQIALRSPWAIFCVRSRYIARFLLEAHALLSSKYPNLKRLS